MLYTETDILTLKTKSDFYLIFLRIQKPFFVTEKCHLWVSDFSFYVSKIKKTQIKEKEFPLLTLQFFKELC